jgi:hypothetical protein
VDLPEISLNAKMIPFEERISAENGVQLIDPLSQRLYVRESQIL